MRTGIHPGSSPGQAFALKRCSRARYFFRGVALPRQRPDPERGDAIALPPQYPETEPVERETLPAFRDRTRLVNHETGDGGRLFIGQMPVHRAVEVRARH